MEVRQRNPAFKLLQSVKILNTFDLLAGKLKNTLCFEDTIYPEDKIKALGGDEVV